MDLRVILVGSNVGGHLWEIFGLKINLNLDYCISVQFLRFKLLHWIIHPLIVRTK